MNPFKELLNDTVFVQKKSGEKLGPFDTAVTTEKGRLQAPIFDESLDVEVGDTLLRPLPNGREETFEIVDVQFVRGLDSIPSSWDLTLSKGSLRAKPSTTTINISNSQGIQIGDHNIQHIVSSIQGLIEKIDSSPASEPEKKVAKGLLRQTLENPTVAAVLGAAAGALIPLLKS